MTVSELIKILQSFPPDATVGAFEPFDANGPCSYTEPSLWLNPDTNVVEIDPQGA